jgi:hypothetical protein
MTDENKQLGRVQRREFEPASLTPHLSPVRTTRLSMESLAAAARVHAAMTSERPPDDYTSELIAAITRVTKSLDLHSFVPERDGTGPRFNATVATTIKDQLDLIVLRGDQVTWLDLLGWATAIVSCSPDTKALRTRLFELAGLLMLWVDDLDARGAGARTAGARDE